jgi:hypothetical protein
MSTQTTVNVSIADAVLLRGLPNTAVLPATITCDSCADVSYKGTGDKPGANNRKSRHKQSLPGQIGDEIMVSFPSDSADTHMAAFITAFVNFQPIPIFVTDKAGMLGFEAVMWVTDWDDTQTLNEVAINKFTLEPYAVGVAGPQPHYRT